MSLTMQTAKQGDIPFQFLRYFSSLDEYYDLLLTNRTDHFEGLEFCYKQTDELCVIAP